MMRIWSFFSKKAACGIGAAEVLRSTVPFQDERSAMAVACQRCKRGDQLASPSLFCFS
ncbi:hypothetical protein VAR608DRAFT_1324 [Variovorax sp. HW608]|uniref:hypothetical protein n=1 Tax=Variovorax sp. HW608 TaxID=1034889 RepID=UPI00081FE390|nr:hypothetical protein [Variovorax sp. HW608]SCK18463.1 hypothetical protein VAR608DRAFT_1324 [Variovorax sp. HW608]